MFRPNKRGREAEAISRQQKLRISLNHNICLDEGEAANIPIQNTASTGLGLLYDDDERNSSITSASGSMTAAPLMMLSLGDSLTNELDRQKQELDQYSKFQEDNLVKGVKDIKQRHMASFLTAIGQSLHEKDFEIENINRENRELLERTKQEATEAQNWHYRAKYNESVISILKTNLQKALSEDAEQMKDSETVILMIPPRALTQPTSLAFQAAP